MDSDFNLYDEAKNRAVVDCLIAGLDVAVALGAPAVRLDPRTSLPVHEEEADLDEVLERMAGCMAEITDVAAQKGLKVCVENHGRLLGRIAQMQRLISLANKPNFGVNIDFTNFRTVFGDDHQEAVRLLAKDVVHVHAKDMLLSDDPQEGDGWRELPPGEYSKSAIGGEGDADWPQVFKILKEAGYDGTISLEVTGPDDILGGIT